MKKVCTKCGDPKELEEFVKDKSCRNGRSHTCKTCHNLYMKKRYATGVCYQKKEITRLSILQKQINRKKTTKKYREKTEDKQKRRIYVLKKQNYWCKTLNDNYIKKVLYLSHGLKVKDITPEMIELKRELILMHRGIKEIRDELNSARD